MPPLLARPLHLLLREIDRSGFVPPIRIMEEVLLRDPEETLPAVTEALEEAFGEPWPALWFVILLGQIRDPGSARLLAKELGHGRLPDPWLAQAAAEALAGIGGDSLHALPPYVRSDTDLCRLYAYATLGWIGGPEACGILLDALARDPEMADAIACALADAACTDAMDALAHALRRCPPFQRSEIERQIVRLHRREGRFTPTALDWRLRYRPVGRRPFASGWPGRLFSVREDLRWESLRGRGPEPRLLEEILAEADLDRRRSDKARSASAGPRGEPGGTGGSGGSGEPGPPGGEDPLQWAPEVLHDLCRILEAADSEAGGTGDVFAVLSDMDFKLSMSAIAGVPLLRAGAGAADEHGAFAEKDDDLSGGDDTIGDEDDDLAGEDDGFEGEGEDFADDEFGEEHSRAPWSPTFEQHPWAVLRYRQLEGPARPGSTDGTAVVRWTDAQPDNPTFDDLREDDPTYADNPAHAAVRTALRWMIERGCEDVRVGVERLRRAAMGGRLLPSGDADTGGHREPTDEVDPTGSGWANHADIPREPVHGSSPRASMQANLPREPAQANPASHGWADHGDPPTEGVHDDNAATPISPDDPLADVRESRIRASLDRYYRAWLDRPLKDLGGRTPRTAKASAVGLLAEYLRGFESAEEARMRDGGVPYDFGWLRRELGMEKRRARKKG